MKQQVSAIGKASIQPGMFASAEQRLNFSRVFKMVCYLADLADFAEFNKIYASYSVSKPARSCVAVKALPLGVLCEIEAMATE